jgi:hypothetical protein
MSPRCGAPSLRHAKKVSQVCYQIFVLHPSGLFYSGERLTFPTQTNKVNTMKPGLKTTFYSFGRA